MKDEESVTAFLEHHGIKGMKWGVRRTGNQSSSETKSKLTSTQKKVILGSAAVAAVVGAAFVAHHLKSKGGVKVSMTTQRNVIELRRAAESQRRLFQQHSTKQVRLLNQANADLRKGFERSMTPHPQREYLDTKFWENALTSRGG
jgi:hypothetical protein